MLYVFHVDTGTMMTFDMNLTLEKVMNLQGVIARGCHIPEDKQVLLISGGECLDPQATVGKYSAGTDTNPFFLFSKSTIEAATPPSPSVNYGSDIDLQGQVEGSLLMPPAYETVVSRAQLALQFQEVDSDELRACERLIHDQHLQQQGWAAVVANLEDITSELQQRSELFHEAYTEYLENRGSYRDLIRSVSSSLELLRKIPLLPGLSPSSFEGASADITLKSTLFDWISSQDTNHSLHDMVEQCDKATEQLDEKVQESLKSEVEMMFKEVRNESMKEVKGLEDRLYGLDQIISGARKIEQDQAELAKGFVQNQNRLSNIRDRSILPDLCSSHRGQLVEMLKNHTRLREIKKKCRMAKEELSVNLHTRLRWVMYVEKKICDVDGKLTIYLGNLKRLKKRLDILQQVHDAPKVYAMLVIEVVRRKMFSQKFLSWATCLAADCKNLQTEEVQRREAFILDIGHHFLQSLFQGLEDYPSPFATEAPDVFDSNLPEISVDDINQLKEEVPELCGILSVPADEELFDGKYKGKDPRQSNTLELLSIPRTLPGNGSDTDIHQNDRKQPYSIEGGSVSLGDQFTECEGDEEIIPKSGFDSLSPPDKEFLLAKSLSDELTQEMKAGKDSPRGKSGEKIKNITSHSVTIQPKEAVNRIRKPSIKSATDMSPDMETSQEFSTADFYIDESMPSSIESPPKTTTSNDSKTNLEQLLNEEKRSNDKLQTDLKDCYFKLSIYESDFRTLREVVEDKLPKVKELVKNFKAAHIDDVEKFQKELEAMKDNLSDVIKQFESRLISNNKNMIDKLTEENLLTLKALNEKLEKSESKCANLMGENKALHSSIEEINMKQKETLEQLQKEKLESNAKLLAEIQDLNLKHELELEVETDKVKSELNVKVGELEKQIDKCEAIIWERDEAIKQLNSDKINQEEKLTEIFQREKDEICDILGKEYDEKLSSAIKEENNKHEEVREMVKAEMKEIHEKEIDRKLEELKQRMLTEREHAIEMTQSTVTLELNKITDEVKQQLLNEKDTELKMLREQLESKFQEDIAKLSSEFNREKESLVELVNTIENKGTHNEESQTAISMFQIVHCDTQTDREPVKVESQVQTDILLQTSSSMQTDLCEQTQFATQTDKVNSISVSAQTETVILTELTTQTDTMQTNEQSVQTEVENGVEKQCAQSLELSDFSALTDSKSHGQMSTQTEIVSIQQFSTQTDKLEQNQTMSQTETVFFQQLATQTDRQEHNQSGTQTDADQKVQTTVKDESSESCESPELSETAETIDSLQKKLQLEYDEKLAQVEEEYNKSMEKLIADLEREKEDAQQLKSSLTSLAGEKQVKFNEAVNKVSQDKDRVIEELRQKEKELRKEIEKGIALMDQLKEEKSKSDNIKDRAMVLLQEKELEYGNNQRMLESELGLARQQVVQYQEQLQALNPEVTSASSPSVINISSDSEEPDLQQKIKDLEGAVKLKDDELSKMRQKVMELSMTASTRSLVQDKVSITSCHVGDLVLLCLDERLDQYVVFTVGTTLHFLHTDCLNLLGLKSDTGESKKQWLIAEVTDKEYCQAKKPNNRFKVPVGTKFYRVKAKPWTREGASSDTSAATASS